MLRKKEFDRHLEDLEAALDQDDDEEWEAEIQDRDSEGLDSLDIEAVRPPAYGHTDGERVVKTTDRIRESLEDRLCTLLEKVVGKQNVANAGGVVGRITSTKALGTPTKEQEIEAQSDPSKPSSKDLRTKTPPAQAYNANRGAGEAKPEQSDESGSEESSQEAEGTEGTGTSEIAQAL